MSLPATAGANRYVAANDSIDIFATRTTQGISRREKYNYSGDKIPSGDVGRECRGGVKEDEGRQRVRER